MSENQAQQPARRELGGHAAERDREREESADAHAFQLYRWAPANGLHLYRWTPASADTHALPLYRCTSASADAYYCAYADTPCKHVRCFFLTIGQYAENPVWSYFIIMHNNGNFTNLKSVLWIRIRQKVKEHINKTVNSGLFVLLDSSIE